LEKEIGGYLELDTYDLPLLHHQALALNCGRNCLAYLIKAKEIRKIVLPFFLCDCVEETCRKENVDVEYYHIGMDLKPSEMTLEEDQWLFVVNYYGQLDNAYLKLLKDKYKRVIVDNTEAYFQMPVPETDTLYTCRKFFGVADGGFLYTDARPDIPLEQDVSFERVRYLLGRYERTASEFYAESAENNDFFAGEPIKKMSKLTRNLLHGINYEKVRQKRVENFAFLHDALGSQNKLALTIPDGAFMYPLYIENGAEIRTYLQGKKIYIPTLWPDVFDHCADKDLEYDLARNILPLPVDQRYGMEDMRRIVREVKQCIG
jgi:hypothetical protein